MTCFLEELKERVSLADLDPSHQLHYFKQAVSDEAKRIPYQHKVQEILKSRWTIWIN